MIAGMIEKVNRNDAFLTTPPKGDCARTRNEVLVD